MRVSASRPPSCRRVSRASRPPHPPPCGAVPSRRTRRLSCCRVSRHVPATSPPGPAAACPDCAAACLPPSTFPHLHVVAQQPQLRVVVVGRRPRLELCSPPPASRQHRCARLSPAGPAVPAATGLLPSLVPQTRPNQERPRNNLISLSSGLLWTPARTRHESPRGSCRRTTWPRAGGRLGDGARGTSGTQGGLRLAQLPPLSSVRCEAPAASAD